MKPKIGTVSQGTTRWQDLLPRFRDLLADLDEDDWFEDLVEDIDEFLHPDVDHEYLGEEADELIDELIEALNELAPPFCYFGSHPGDGCDYGFWPDLDALEDAVRCRDILKVSDLSEVPNNYFGEVMLVNDHGNITFYTPRVIYEEVWGVV